MSRVSCWFAWLFVSLTGSTSAQQVTTVQLPTYSSFSVQTTVVVPDRGSMILGAISRAGSSGTQFGVPGLRSRGVPFLGARSISRAASASSVSVHATIIDNRAMDRAVLAEAARRGNRGANASRLPAEDIAARIQSIHAAHERGQR
jgi:type II secretory pathway component GspD/PulD (secretin)